MAGFSESDLDALAQCSLFQGYDARGIEEICERLGAHKRSYLKDEIIFMAGSEPTRVCVIIAGSVQMIRETAEGDRTVLDERSAPSSFGESPVISRAKARSVTALAQEDATILFVPLAKLLPLARGCDPLFLGFVDNLLFTLARQNIRLTRRFTYLQPYDLRSRLSRYLHFYQKYSGSDSFSIPFNRDELASFLAVNRSALSRELSRMRDEGLIEYSRESFTILADLPDI